MTKDEYKAYVASVDAFFEREGILYLNSKGEEPYFSHSLCECCNRPLGGTREDATGCHTKTDEIFEYSVCLDCLYFAEYGQLDDMTMLDMEDSEEDYTPSGDPIPSSLKRILARDSTCHYGHELCATEPNGGCTEGEDSNES